MHDILLGIISSFIFLSILLLLEKIGISHHYPKELSRKCSHVLGGLFALLMSYLLSASVFIFFTLLFFFIMYISFHKNFFTTIHQVDRKTYGELFFPLGIMSAYILSRGNDSYYLAAILILTFSDTSAGVVGSILKSKTKTMLGSTVFFIISLLILLLLFPNHFFLVLFLTFGITFIERISLFGTDNLSIPIGILLLLSVFQM